VALWRCSSPEQTCRKLPAARCTQELAALFATFPQRRKPLLLNPFCFLTPFCFPRFLCLPSCSS